MDVGIKFGDSTPNGSRDIRQRSRRRRHFRFRSFFLNFDNFQSEAVNDVLSGMAIRDTGMDACVNFGDSTLKPSEASFLVVFGRR